MTSPQEVYQEARQQVFQDLIDTLNDLSDEPITLDVLSGITPGGCHLAILREPYLTLIIEGKKTIESRFSANKSQPYGKVWEGDILLLKRVSGSIVAIATVEKTEYFSNLTPTQLQAIVKSRNDGLQISDDWMKRKGSSRYASLFYLSEVVEITPVNVIKTDRRPWVVL